MTSGKFKSNDGLSLAYCIDSPNSDPSRAVILVVHGLGDHSQSSPYRYLTNFLIENSYTVFRYDLRGHGRSDGKRGHVDSFTQHRSDLTAAISEARSITSCECVYLIAASMGGLIALDHVLTSGKMVDGVVAIAPALSSKGASRFVRMAVPFVSAIFPELEIDPGLDLSSISRDQRAVSEYTSDPFFSTKLTMKAAAEIMKTVTEVNGKAEHLAVPLLVLHGSADNIVPPESSSEFFTRITKTSKERILYPDARHNLLIETNRQQVCDDILKWLKKQDSSC